MSISIPLSPEADAMLRERAQAAGEDITSFAARVFHDALTSPSVDELLAPISDDELDDFYDGLRSKVWEENRTRRT